MRVARTARPPVLDGVLDEAEWRGAGFVDDLEQVQPVEHAEPFERTEVYLLYDDDALYVGARLYDTDPELITANVLRQNSWIVPDDSFYVTLDPFNTGRAGFFFGTNPNGVRYDGTYRNVSEIYDNWDGIFEAAAGYFEDGWIAEFAIPFKTLSFDPNTDGWGLNFSLHVPYDEWLRGVLRPLFFDHLTKFSRANPGVLDIDHVHRLFTQTVSGGRDDSYMLWKILNFMIWANNSRVAMTGERLVA